MQINKDRLPGSRRLKVLEAKERTQQAEREAKQAFANYQSTQAQTAPVIPGGQQGIGLPPEEAILSAFDAYVQEAWRSALSGVLKTYRSSMPAVRPPVFRKGLKKVDLDASD